MVKKFTANCDAGGRSVPVTLYIGNPSTGNHPLNFQNRWLSETKGVSVPLNIMRSFAKLSEISEKHRVSFEELCGYVIEELKASKSIVDDAAGAKSLAEDNKKVAPVAKPPVAQSTTQGVSQAQPPVSKAPPAPAQPPISKENPALVRPPVAKAPAAKSPVATSQTPPAKPPVVKQDVTQQNTFAGNNPQAQTTAKDA